MTPARWLAIGIVLAAATIVVALTGAVEAGLVTLVAGIAAVLAAAAGGESGTTDTPVAAAPTPTILFPALDAIVEPVLLLRGGRVLFANAAARVMLGEHLIGEDARTAIRHPAAADYLMRDEALDSGEPIELVGLGTLDQRWEMRAASLGDGMRLVHLINQTGSYAAERMRVDFVANASHELRTPLASILGYVETLSDEAGEDPTTRARFLRIVLDEAHRMERLVEDLMSLSRIEAEKFRLPADQIDLAALAADVRDALADSHDGRGRDIALSVADGFPEVAGERAQLSQLLHNLIGNAMKYGRAGTPIRVDLTHDDATVRLVVADRGDGIPAEHLPRLTERFYRVDPGRSRAMGGTGLGLAIVKHIVERHRGRLDIASVPGEGTTVTVTLRAVDGAVIKA